jgi:hypothetical protein
MDTVCRREKSFWRRFHTRFSNLPEHRAALIDVRLGDKNPPTSLRQVRFPHSGTVSTMEPEIKKPGFVARAFSS